jgi:hypothetical protein
MNAIIICLLLCITTVFGSQSGAYNFSERLQIETNNNTTLTVRVNLEGLTSMSVDRDTDFSFSGEGVITTPGFPALPTYSSWVLVPPGKKVEISINRESTRTVRSIEPPSLNPLNQQYGADSEWAGDHIFPRDPVVVSQTGQFRHYRLAQITYYPVQYDPQAQSYILRSELEVDINFVDDEDQIQNRVNFKRTPSPDMQTLLETMVINPPPHRDAQELILERGYRDFILVVVPERIRAEDRDDIPRIRHLIDRLIEWKLRAGDKVEVLLVDEGSELDAESIKDLIVGKYSDLEDDFIEPFDNILLIGEEDDEPYGNNAGRMGEEILLFARRDTLYEAPGWFGHWDMWYTYLDGDDFIPDVALSRIHAGNLAMLANGINKTLSYESEPYIEDDSWFTKAIVAQERIENGGPTVTYTVDYYMQALEHSNKRVVGEFRPEDGEDSGEWIGEQMNGRIGFMAGRAVNRGLAYHNGGRPDEFMDATNAFPIGIFNSGHGEWAMESLYWVGREFYEDPANMDDVSGAKGAVATTCAWMSPDTVPNNSAGTGMVHAMLDLRLSFAWARNWTLMNLARTYPGDIDLVNWYANNFSLCGDVSVRQWEGVPEQIEVQYPTELPIGSAYIPVSITAQDDEHVMSGVMVTLLGWNDDDLEFSELAFTNADGKCEFVIDPDFDGTLQLTATGQDIYPHKGEIERVEPDGYLDAMLISIDDEAGGNGDGNINPGEQINMVFSVTNSEADARADSVRGKIISSSLFVEIINNRLEFGNITAGQTAESQNEASIRIAPDCPDGEMINLIFLTTSTNGFTSIDAFQLEPFSADIEITNLPEGGVINGGDVELNFELTNNGRAATDAITATLISNSWGINVTAESVAYNAIQPDGNFTPEESFAVSFHNSHLSGMKVPMTLLLESEGVQVGKINFELQLSTAENGDPYGPDSYGYYAFDGTDQGYDQRPEYDWVEISLLGDPELAGVPLDIIRGDRDNGWGVVELPFTFRYYGVDYDWITVSTNGFIAMGTDKFAVPNPQNWSLEGGGAGGPYGMIAPFWDNIYIPNNGGIFTVYDDWTDSFIIEWYFMRHHGGERDLTFQVVLQNPATTPTATMDGQINYYYKTITQAVGNLQSNTPYASVGISSGEANAGISYTTANEYPVTSSELGNQHAIVFTTTPHHMTGTLSGRVTDKNGAGVSEVTISTSHGGEAVSAENGSWTLDDGFAESPIDVYFSKAGHYTTEKKNLTIPEGAEVNLNTMLMQSVVSIDPANIHSFQESNFVRTRPLTIDNRGGSEAINWTVQKTLPNVDNPEPWEQLIQINLTEALEAHDLYGIAFANDQFYITGIDREDQPVIFIMSSNLGFDGAINQPGEGEDSMTDLSWDGEFLWGARGNTVYQFNTDGEVVHSMEMEDLTVNSITWDPIEELLWVVGSDEYLHGFDLEGVEQHTIFTNGLRISGIHAMSPNADGFSIIAYSYPTALPAQYLQTFHMINTDTEEIQFVKSLNAIDGPSTGGIFITNTYEADSWITAILSRAMINGELRDIIEIYQLKDNVDWIELSHEHGMTEAGNITTVDLLFDSGELEAGEYGAGIIVDVDILDELFEIDVTMHVIEGEHPPIEFDLSSPGNNSYTDTLEVIFEWDATYDPNEGDEVSYIFWVSDGNDSLGFATDEDSFTYDPVGEFGLNIGDRINWWTNAVSNGDTVECNERFTLIYDTDGIGDDAINYPIEFGLHSIYPNPFNSTTSIKVGIESIGIVSLTIYDITGREVTRLADESLAVGYHTFSVSAMYMASGLYVVRLEQMGKVATRKMILIR